MSTFDASSSDEENQVHGRMPQNMKSANGSQRLRPGARHDDREDERVDEKQRAAG